ncbi:CENP-Q, a CENPA-CAD centromere complex subunit-domain-containing protein, partial [Dichotomopilus funicola]
QGAKKRRGRPPRTSGEAGSPSQPAEAPGSTNPRRRHKKSPQRRTSFDTNQPSRQQQQQQQDQESENEPQPPPPSRPHQLTTLTRHIPRTTIASKWAPLSTPSINAISSLLRDSARPVLHRLRERDQRHAQAASILRTFSTRLHAKLVKGMPFPPPAVPAPKVRGRKPKDGGDGGGGGGGGGHETELNFEKTVDAIAGLERALDPLLHSVVLLKGEKEREEKALERDYENLRRLEGNARAQARGWREGKGKGREHVLVGGIGAGEGRDEEKGDGLNVVSRTAGVEGGGVFQDLQDEALVALSQQIGNHMESMKSNLSQIDGVLPAIARSRAALQGALCEHLDPEQYEQVLLG